MQLSSYTDTAVRMHRVEFVEIVRAVAKPHVICCTEELYLELHAMNYVELDLVENPLLVIWREFIP